MVAYFTAQFSTELVELAETPFLGTLVSEKGSNVESFERRWIVDPDTVLDESPDDACSSFRPHRDMSAFFVEEVVHLLFDDIGRFADTALEKGDLFQNRRSELAEISRSHHLFYIFFHLSPAESLFSEEVVHSFDC